MATKMLGPSVNSPVGAGAAPMLLPQLLPMPRTMKTLSAMGQKNRAVGGLNQNYNRPKDNAHDMWMPDIADMNDRCRRRPYMTTETVHGCQCLSATAATADTDEGRRTGKTETNVDGEGL